MNNQLPIIFQQSIKTLSLFIVGFLFVGQLGYGQIPIDPVPCTPNIKPRTMPDTAFICEGVPSVFLNPQISGGNFTWYREDNGSGVYSPAGSSTGLAGVVLTGSNTKQTYYLLHQTSATGCYFRDTVIVTKKSLATQLDNEKEFERPSGKPLFLCSGQPKPFFNTAGNTKYSYLWTPASLFTGSTNIKNAKFNGTYPKGASSVGQFAPELIITEKSSTCSFKKKLEPIVYPPPNPDFGAIKSSYCQNVPEELSVRVFIVKTYSIKSATLQIGNDPIINMIATDFSKISTDKLIPNTLGEVIPPATVGKRLNNSTILVDSVRRKISSTTFGNIPVKFTMVTDSGCTATISTNITVNQSPTYTLEVDPLTPTKTSFCINDSKIGPLKSNPVNPGKFEGPGVTGDATSGYFFTPALAGDGTHNITFAVNTATPGVCAGGGAITVTVKPAPKPKIVGRANVCPGSTGVEYRDTAKHSATTIRQPWKILNSASAATGITPAPYGSNGDSIRVTFPNTYTDTQTPARAFIVATNDDGGCIATETLQVAVNNFEKSPKPIGPDTGCIIPGSNILKYKSGSPASLAFTHTWNIVGATSNTPSLDKSENTIVWDVSATTRTVQVTDVSSQGLCNIESDPLKIIFINAPKALIKNPQPLAACAGAIVNLEVDTPEPNVTYTWSITNVKGAIVPYTLPPYKASDAIIKYNLTSEIANCPPQKSIEKELIIKPTPSDPLPYPPIEHCFDDEPIKEITVVFNNVTPPPAPGPSALWANPLDINNLDVNRTTWKASTAGIYSVKVTDGVTSCSTNGSVEIIEICNAKFFLPKAFSPNGDTYNDTLTIFGNHFTDFDFKIFSRWGEVIFSTKDPKQTWDGNYGGLPMPEGTYPWSVRYESINAKKKKVTETKDGSISLIR